MSTSLACELFYKTPEKNTLGERHLKAISEGTRVTATPTQPGRYGAEAVGVSNINLRGRFGVITDPTLIEGMPRPVLQGPVGVNSMMSGFDAKLPSLAGKSINQLIREGGLTAEGNSQVPNWISLWDAMRADLTIRKIARPTVRELIYNVTDTPGASRTMNLNEFFPHAVIFEENNGTGQSVRQAELRGGSLDTAQQKIYAAALTFDLLAALFGGNYTEQSISDAVAIGENGLKDELALAPIFAYTYAAEAQTAADATGTTREEMLYRTIQNGIDKLGVRTDPATGRELDTTGLILVAAPVDARHIYSIIGGQFPASNNSGPYLSLDGSLARIIGYDPETVIGETETVSYTSVPTKKAYLIKPNRKLSIAIKRRLQLNVNMAPSPATLAQEQKAWWFCEALYNAGIADYIQEISLPAWAIG